MVYFKSRNKYNYAHAVRLILYKFLNKLSVLLSVVYSGQLGLYPTIIGHECLRSLSMVVLLLNALGLRPTYIFQIHLRE